MTFFRTTDSGQLLEIDAFGFVTAFLEQDYLLMRSEKQTGQGRVRMVWDLSSGSPTKVFERGEPPLHCSDVYDKFRKEILSGGHKIRIDHHGNLNSVKHQNLNYVVCFSDPLYITEDGSLLRLYGEEYRQVVHLVGDSFEITPDMKRIVSVAKGRQSHIRISVWSSDDGAKLHKEEHLLPADCGSFGHKKPSFQVTEKIVLVAVTRAADEIPCLLLYDLDKLLEEGKPEARCLVLTQLGPLYEAPQLAVEGNLATVAGKAKQENVVKHLNMDLDL